MSDLSIQPDPYIKSVADQLIRAREEYEAETRLDLLKRIDSMCLRWRHIRGGWDVDNYDTGQGEALEKALDLLSECYEELRPD